MLEGFAAGGGGGGGGGVKRNKNLHCVLYNLIKTLWKHTVFLIHVYLTFSGRMSQ